MHAKIQQVLAAKIYKIYMNISMSSEGESSCKIDVNYELHNTGK